MAPTTMMCNSKLDANKHKLGPSGHALFLTTKKLRNLELPAPNILTTATFLRFGAMWFKYPLTSPIILGSSQDVGVYRKVYAAHLTNLSDFLEKSFDVVRICVVFLRKS